MAIKPKLLFLIVVVVVLTGSLAWANPLSPVTGDPPPDDAVASTDPIPFDPFDNPSGDSYGDVDEELHAVADPIAGFNRAMFVFNDKLYFITGEFSYFHKLISGSWLQSDSPPRPLRNQ